MRWAQVSYSNTVFVTLRETGGHPYKRGTCRSHRRKADTTMPMIDVYILAGKVDDTAALARSLATTLMKIEEVPDIAMFRQNTPAFIHELPPASISNVDGDEDCCRVQVLTNHGALDRAKQLRVVAELTSLIAGAITDQSIRDRIWVLLTEAPDGGWGLNGHANTNEELVASARAELANGPGA